jgi:uncharacterized protein (DUF924 family)
MASTAIPATTRDQRLWSEEVARVLAAAPTFTPVVRRAVRTTLHAFAADPSTDAAVRADVAVMLAATSSAAPPRTRFHLAA